MSIKSAGRSKDSDGHDSPRITAAGSIKVLLVDDSLVVLTILQRMLALDPGIQVVGTAGDGKRALELIPVLRPTVICTDLHMPVMDGLQLTREVMARYPTPILVVSISVQEGSDNVFKLLDAGAVDVFPKPRAGLGTDFERVAPDFIQRVRIVSGVHVFRKVHREGTGRGSPPAALPSELPLSARIVVIGASTGGPSALQSILKELGADYPLPVICIQHIGEGFLNGLVDWLGAACRMKVGIAGAGDYPLPGRAYFPREGAHLVLDRNGRFAYSNQPPLDGHRPSITVTMQSVAQHYGNAAVGVLLTGMGRDGADGLLAISRAGGPTIAQDEETSVVFGMPRQAIEIRAAGNVLGLPAIASTLGRLGRIRSNTAMSLDGCNRPSNSPFG